MDVWSCLGLVACAGVVAVIVNGSWRFSRAAVPSRLDDTIPTPAPSLTLVVPCKAAPPQLREIFEGLIHQDYPHFQVVFALSSANDPAFPIAMAAAEGRANVHVHVAGYSDRAAEKTHNMASAIESVPSTELYAFADSDIRVDPSWLRTLVAPLRHRHVGVTTAGKVPWVSRDCGFWASSMLRLFFAVALLSFGMPNLASAWGGSMAVRRDTLRRLKILDIWRRAVDDDVSISNAVRQGGLDVHFVPIFIPTRVPEQFVPAFQWCVRQCQYLWLYYRPAWTCSSFLAIVPPIVGTSLATLYALDGSDWASTLWGGFIVGHVALVARILKTVDRATAQVTSGAFPMWLAFVSPMVVPIIGAAAVASAFRRTMVWGGVVYRVRGPEDVEVVSRQPQPHWTSRMAQLIWPR